MARYPPVELKRRPVSGDLRLLREPRRTHCHAMEGSDRGLPVRLPHAPPVDARRRLIVSIDKYSDAAGLALAPFSIGKFQARFGTIAEVL